MIAFFHNDSSPRDWPNYAIRNASFPTAMPDRSNARGGLPYPPEPRHSTWTPKRKAFHEHGARIEAAFRKYFHRASTKQAENSFELIVCHANVIRYFVCRALQFPPEGWLRISLAHTSITWIQIYPNGRVCIRAMGDFGHLPPEKISFE